MPFGISQTLSSSRPYQPKANRPKVTVYGHATLTSGSISTSYICTLSPYFNPISTDKSVTTTQPSLAACVSRDGATNWVYYIASPE